jgi:hypothetical protein
VSHTHADAEVVAVVLADVLDEVDGVVEPALGRLPLVNTARRVSSKGENVAATRVVRFLLYVGSTFVSGLSGKT